MERWTAIARKLAATVEFGRPDFDAKKATNRFNALLEAHRKLNRESAQASGMFEEVTEKTELLDDLLCAFDDAKEAEIQRIEDTKKKQENDEQMGLVVRDEAMQAMGKRKRTEDDESSGGSGNGKLMKVKERERPKVFDMSYNLVGNARRESTIHIASSRFTRFRTSVMTTEGIPR